MTVLKQYNVATSQWEPIVTGTIGATGPTGVTGATGPTGPLGIISSATAPVSPSAGQVWFNTTTGASYIYYNSAWVELGGGSMSPMQTTSSARPAGPWTGQTIYDTDTKIGYQYDGTNWGPTYPGSGFRNKIINGGFDIWQRGTNYTTAGGGYGSADRWYSGFATGSFTQQSFALGNGIAGYEPQYFGRWTISSNSQNYELIQKLEGVRSFAGQQITISFWARQTSGTVSVNGRWVQYFGTGGSPSSSVVTNFAVPLTVTGSWVRYQYTINVPSISGKTIGTANDDSCWLSFQVVNTATGSLDFWGVQVESGPQATPFEQRPYGTELALCQRYYQKSYPTATPAGTGVIVAGLQQAPSYNAAANGNSLCTVTFQTAMRANPTITIYSYANGTAGAISNVTGSDLAAGSGASQFITTSSFNLYNASGGTITPTLGGYLFHFQASAEL